jgi:hypothetical protein
MEQVVAYADKTIVKIEGIKVKGLKPEELEEKIYDLFKRPVRVVGVTSDSLEMDIYNLPPERIIKDKEGVIKVLSLVPGLTATEIAKISKLKKAKAVDVKDIIPGSQYACAAERRF